MASLSTERCLVLGPQQHTNYPTPNCLIKKVREMALASLRQDIEAANVTFNAILREIEAEFSQSTRKDESSIALQANRGLRADLREWGAHTIVLSTERRASRQGIVPGHILLDSKFTERAMTQELRSGRFSLVHVASHFFFNPGDERQSFLLLGDGNRITLQQIRNAAELQFAGVELLTLSACDTAMGGTGADGKEIEGFAVLAQEQGAKAVLATLWPVPDASTQLLMTELYRQRQTYSLAKAEALRRGQLGLLIGKMNSNNITKTRGSELVGEAGRTRYKADPQKPYAHPYYWAPFILIGNWR